MEKRILTRDTDYEVINIIYRILRKSSGEMMKKGLFCWMLPYSKRAIRKDCKDKVVVLVWDVDLDDFSSTFQMFAKNGVVYVRKMTTLPEYEGLGVASRNMAYVEAYAQKMDCPSLHVEMFARNKAAVAFYEHLGFKTIATKQLWIFKTLVMEKALVMEEPRVQQP